MAVSIQYHDIMQFLLLLFFNCRIRSSDFPSYFPRVTCYKRDLVPNHFYIRCCYLNPYCWINAIKIYPKIITTRVMYNIENNGNIFRTKNYVRGVCKRTNGAFKCNCTRRRTVLKMLVNMEYYNIISVLV